ncbi:MAG: argininosuccinate lyase [Lentisphaerae bacterium RIFOXYA12_FULL_48_11]|nr:MAG: argininosuccinate lyase [Lentisphaerae bacterium RIFOXYA12_FULL_48_11]
MKSKVQKTIVGRINDQVLDFTAGRDIELDVNLINADCIGSAAHARMLSKVPVKPRILSEQDVKKVIVELVRIMKCAGKGTFKITAQDQDVHLAVERTLTSKLGHLGKKIHTARSRNDQVAVDLRLYGKEQMLGTMNEAVALADCLLKFAAENNSLPMVGRTHLQPAMPSSVGLWASAYAEALLDDLKVLKAAYDFNNRCPLGSAAGYGVPLKIDRKFTSYLLGFEAPVHNVLYASNARGKCEEVILSAMSQVMLTLSRLAEDLILYSMPEFGYFSLPKEFCTGSSIMPQKSNPDVLELVRAKTSRVVGCAFAAAMIVKGLPGGYNRDLQEIKELYIEGMFITRTCLQIVMFLVGGIKAGKIALEKGFTPDVFATDRVMELVAGGMPFREAYDHVKANLGELAQMNPLKAVSARTHLGAPGNTGLGVLKSILQAEKKFVMGEQGKYYKSVSRLLGINYPQMV